MKHDFCKTESRIFPAERLYAPIALMPLDKLAGLRMPTRPRFGRRSKAKAARSRTVGQISWSFGTTSETAKRVGAKAALRFHIPQLKVLSQ
jgi:hypothetical protein